MLCIDVNNPGGEAQQFKETNETKNTKTTAKKQSDKIRCHVYIEIVTFNQTGVGWPQD